MRFAELFAGAGGLSMGLERAGWECSWHAEIADAPRAILSHRWLDVPLYGDVLALDGRALTAKHGAIDMLTGGSPCQDLSVAGKRAGMVEGSGTRSSLFFEQMRLWDETGADLCLWENVDGARSSNDGKDFGEVLRAFVGAAIAVPSDGWRSAGVAAGPTGVAAWRVLDAQFFGVPQRRRRVFVLGTRTGTVDPAEVLSLTEGVRGDSPTRREAGKGTAADAESRPPITFVLGSDPVSRVGGASQPVTGRNGDPGCVVAFNVKQDGADADLIAPTLLAMPHDQSHANGGGQLGVVAFDTMNQTVGDVAHTLRDPHGTFGDALPAVLCLTGDVTHALTHEGHDASEDGTGRGTPIVAIEQAVGEYKLGDVASALNEVTATDHRNPQTRRAPHGIPRRLTPLECERLMGWPDSHTLIPDAKGKLLSDAARYKACGNGVASPVAHWIGWRLALTLGASA